MDRSKKFQVQYLQSFPQLIFKEALFFRIQKIYYRMFRAIPTNNKLCFDKQLKRSWRIHEEKLRSIKSSINRQPPQHFNFLDQRPKKFALNDVRNFQIEKQNHSLLSKIKSIGEKGSKTSYLKVGPSNEKKRTLNEGHRKKQLVKIVQQNQDIIKRINMKKSMYNVRRWQKERKRVQKNINLISSFPYKNYPKTHTQVNLWMTEDENENERKENLSLSKSRLKKQYLLFNGTHRIGEDFYFIQTKLNNKIFSIQIQNLQIMNQKYKLELDEAQAISMLDKNFDGQIINLLNCLTIDQRKGICQLKCISDQSELQQAPASKQIEKQ